MAATLAASSERRKHHGGSIARIVSAWRHGKNEAAAISRGIRHRSVALA